jgi:hypothetical protein
LNGCEFLPALAVAAPVGGFVSPQLFPDDNHPRQGLGRRGYPTLRCSVKSRDILYILSLDILYNGWRGTGPRNPALDDFRALDSGVQFANQSRAVENHHALLDPNHLYPLSGE